MDTGRPPHAAASAAWDRLDALGRGPEARSIRALFSQDAGRFERFSRRAAGLLLDFSKTSIGDEALSALFSLAKAVDLVGARDAMARGEPINTTERRAVLHMALRTPLPEARAQCDEATRTLAYMRAFVESVHRGELRGATNQRFDTVLNIGIGGSDLGPTMVSRALWRAGDPMRPIHLGNVDGHGWENVLPMLDPRRTLVLVSSKTFTTAETMANARLVKSWMEASVGRNGASAHFCALSSNVAACEAFGIAADRVFQFQDWVGGRFSLWSAIGMSLALSLGMERFLELLSGARDMDEHFLSAPIEDNLPFLLALVEVWHVNGLGYSRRAVLPYDERLRRLPAHLQQLEMESLGKGVTLEGLPVERATGPVVFGEPGTSAQHSFLQLLHQGPDPVPVDFILVARPDHRHMENHRILLANALAQGEALLTGRAFKAVVEEMQSAGLSEQTVRELAPHRVFPGDRPSVAILLPALNARTLGSLIALYEHKVFALGRLWNVNAFDQWGVELGKQLASPLLGELAGAPRPERHDASTNGLLAEIIRMQAGR